MATETTLNPRIEPADSNRSLYELMGDEFYENQRGKLQIINAEIDAMRRVWYTNLFEPKYGPLRLISVDELWQEFGIERKFETTSWDYFKMHFGTADMYADPEHQKGIHGDGHLERVPNFAYCLGQYKDISKSEMKVLLVAASVHDRARRDDRVAPNHGLDSAINFNNYAEYEIQPNLLHVVRPYIQTYLDCGITFTDEEIQQIELSCEYHEKTWDEAKSELNLDKRTLLLIQILQAADAADRFRAPSPQWWPKPEYFDDFFRASNGLVDERAQEGFLRFAAHFTLASEKARFEEQLSVDDAIRRKMEEVGIIETDL